MPANQLWYELPFRTWRSGDLSVALSLEREHKGRDTTRLYEDAILEGAKEYDDPLASARAPAQQVFRTVKWVAD